MKKKTLRRPLSPLEKERKKPTQSISLPKIDEEEVQFIEGRKRKNHEYWHIKIGETRIGHISIIFKEYASISITLHKEYRGKGIGTLAFRRATEMSQWNEIIATIRKSNLASRYAAERAGFVVEDPDSNGQLIMHFRKES
jgi:RimJ/RimL family protein N-acetyltransferase